MIITKTILKECTRMDVTGIKSIAVTPCTKAQLILGTNGSGKTTFVNLGLSPLPPPKEYFRKGGGCFRTIRSNGKVYKVETEFLDKPVHRFIVDGVELNKGHTETVQRELVKEHFGITQEIHNLFTDAELFTNMTAARRREWITKFSKADFKYALDLHARLKKEHRANVTIAKHNANRLITERAKLIDNDEYKSLTSRLRVMRDKLRSLMANFDQSLANSSRDILKRYNSTIAELTAMIRDVPDRSSTEYTKLNITDLSSRISGVTTDISVCKSRLDTAYLEYDAANEKYTEFMAVQQEDISDVKRAILEIGDELNEIGPLNVDIGQSTAVLSGAMSDITRLVDRLSAIVPDISRIESELGIPSDEQLLTPNMVINEITEIDAQVRSLLSDKGKIETRLEHLLNGEKVECPTCKSNFIPGLKSQDPDAYRSALVKIESNVTELSSQRDKWSTKLEIVRLRDTVYNTLSALYGEISYKGYVSTGKPLVYTHECVCELIETLSNLATSYTKAIYVKDLQSKLESYNSAVDKANGLRNAASSITLEYTSRKAEVDTLAERYRKLKALLDSLNTNYVANVKLLDVDTKITELCNKVVELESSYYDSIYHQQLNQEINKLMSSISMVEQSISTQEVQLGIIANIESDMEAASNKAKKLGILVETLSPTTGIIAEQIGTFINGVIKNINKEIARYWHYDFRLLPCDLADGELTCQFPIVAGGGRAKDISEGSESMVNAINQAFKIVAYRYLNLNHYPLYLDEPESGLDEAHKAKLGHVIKQMVDDDRFSQVFIISHMMACQYTMPNCQKVVIDESNLSVVGSYNEHVTIVRNVE